MIDLYFAPTPNGLKARLFLEEAQLPYRIVPVRLGKGEQFRPDYLAISPNSKIPAIVDHEPADGGAPLALFESGAILWHLAQKTGRLLPRDERGRAEVLQWLFWQMSALGPMAGQIGHFNAFAPEPVPYAIERYARETRRLYAVLDRRLADREFIVGGLSRPSMASEGPSRPSVASGALGLLPVAVGLLPGGLSRPSMASEALGLLPGGLSRPSMASEALGLLPGEFSIADIACYPWIVPHRGHGQDLAEFPHLERWFETISARPATQRVYAGVEDVYARTQPLTEEARRVLFGHAATTT
jgi:GST-like protein